MRTRTRKQDMLTVYIVGTTSKPELRGVQPGHPFSEMYRSMLCVSRVAAFDWFLCRLLKVFNTRFYYDIREGEGEGECERENERGLCAKLVCGEGRLSTFQRGEGR